MRRHRHSLLFAGGPIGNNTLFAVIGRSAAENNRVKTCWQPQR